MRSAAKASASPSSSPSPTGTAIRDRHADRIDGHSADADADCVDPPDPTTDEPGAASTVTG